MTDNPNDLTVEELDAEFERAIEKAENLAAAFLFSLFVRPT